MSGQSKPETLEKTVGTVGKASAYMVVLLQALFLMVGLAEFGLPFLEYLLQLWDSFLQSDQVVHIDSSEDNSLPYDQFVHN